MNTANIQPYITIPNPSKLKKEVSSIPKLIKITLIDLAVVMILALGMPVFAANLANEKTSFTLKRASHIRNFVSNMRASEEDGFAPAKSMTEKFTGIMSGILTGEAVSEPSPKASVSGSRSGWLYSHHFQLASRGELAGYPAMTMEATAYEPSPRSCGPHAHGVTATGMRAMVGVVAVDPRVIPLGSRLYVEGYGYAIAADTGGAIKGNRIDVYYDTIPQALQWGRKMVRVYILSR